MAELPANYIFLPWVRQGAASGIQSPDMPEDQKQKAVISIKVKLRVNSEPSVSGIDIL